MKTNLLLSPELRAKVEQKTRECLTLAEKKYKRKFDFPIIRFDIKNHDGGRAYITKNLIRYNLILLIENEKDFIDNVVPHETAHIINRQVSKIPSGKKRLMPHGKEWKDIMLNLFNVKPRVRHSYDCSSIEKGARRHQKRNPMNKVLRIIKEIENLNDEQLLHLKKHLRDFL